MADIFCVLCTPGADYTGQLIVGVNAHRECMLRAVVGGIGHLIAHEYWCLQKGDPDAGLDYQQSARLVDLYVAMRGIEASVSD